MEISLCLSVEGILHLRWTIHCVLKVHLELKVQIVLWTKSSLFQKCTLHLKFTIWLRALCANGTLWHEAMGQLQDVSLEMLKSFGTSAGVAVGRRSEGWLAMTLLATYILVSSFPCLLIATLGSILDSQLNWESGKFQLARWSHEVALFPAITGHPPSHQATHPPGKL